MITMTTISIPIWVLATAIGVPSISLLWLVIALVRRKRKSRRGVSAKVRSANMPKQQPVSTQFEHDLMCMQIDAVFNGLAALIETERLKLKSLMLPMSSPVRSDTQTLPANHNPYDEQTERQVDQDAAVDEQIAQCIAAGKNPAGVANQLGISLSEVELVMKMNESKKSKAGHKLEAVA